MLGAISRLDSRKLLLVLVVAGLLLQWAAWSRQGLGDDQRILLALGQELASGENLRPLGKPMSSGMQIPSTLQQIIVGAPLLLWDDYRAPALLVAICHLAALIIFFRTARSLAGSRLAAALAIVLWFCPWRVFHSGTLWEPNYLLLVAALHFWACVESRSEARFGASFLVIFSIVLFAQVHPSCVVLLAWWLILVARGHVRISLPGIVTGGAAGALPVLPALVDGRIPRAVQPLMSEHEAVSTLGLMALNLPKTLLYWARLPSLDVGDRLLEVSVQIASAIGGASATSLGRLIGIGIMVAVTFVMLAQARTIFAFVRRGPVAVHPSARSWLRSYFLTGVAASLLCALLVPFAVQGWYLLGLLPVACIPLADAIATARTSRKENALAALVGLVVLNAIVSFFLVFWHPAYIPPKQQPPTLTRSVEIDTPAPGGKPSLKTDPGAGPCPCAAARPVTAR
jgi:hypothetical protein